MKLIDSHCHLNYDYSPKTEADLVHEAELAGITHLVTVGTDLKSLPRVIEISEKFSQVFHTVGVHPHDTVEMADTDLEILRLAARHPKCRAMGEIGLDYHYDHSSPEIQKKRLHEQLDLALEVALPIVVHSREAEQDLLPALRDYARKLSPEKIPGVIHCFTGTLEFGRACIELGFYISFSGILTFKKAQDLRDAAKAFPLERLLLETDSPYLAPIPFRGKKCEPSMIQSTAQKLAEVKSISIDEVARITSENSKRVFRLP